MEEQSNATLDLQHYVQELELRLSGSIPRAELDAMKAKAVAETTRLEDRIRELEAKLTRSVPKTMFEDKLTQNENLAKTFAQLRDEKTQADLRVTNLIERAKGLEAQLGETSSRAEAKQVEADGLRKDCTKLSNDVNELEAKLNNCANDYANLLKLGNKETAIVKLKEAKMRSESLKTVLANLTEVNVKLREEVSRLTARLSEQERGAAGEAPRTEVDAQHSEVDSLRDPEN
jgi:chromosome segregation ATPase